MLISCKIVKFLYIISKRPNWQEAKRDRVLVNLFSYIRTWKSKRILYIINKHLRKISAKKRSGVDRSLFLLWRNYERPRKIIKDYLSTIIATRTSNTASTTRYSILYRIPFCTTPTVSCIVMLHFRFSFSSRTTRAFLF